jgi:hypothetical protein
MLIIFVFILFSCLQLLKFENFELSIRSNDIDHDKSRTATSQPISRVFLKSFVGGYFSLNSIFRPDNGVRGGYVECTDFDIHIPDLLLEFDEISLKSLLFLLSVLSPSSSVSKSNSAGDVTAEAQLRGTGKGKRTERTQWETDLNIDLDEIPKATLRTLLWLEKQSVQTDTGTGAGAGVRVGERKEEGDDDLDYDRLRELMTKYLLSKKSLEEDAVITKTIKEQSSRPLSNLAETLCDSDSGEDFPDDTHSDSDFADVEGEEEWEGEDGSEFQDAAEGRGWSMGQSSIRRVKMGQVCSDLIGNEKGGTEALQDRGRRQTKSSASRSGMDMDMSMSHSVYGAKSIATMDSGMFHSTREGSSFSSTNKGGLTGSTESGFYRKINKETRIRMHLAVVKVRLRDLAVLSTTHDHVSTVETPDVAADMPMSVVVTEEVTDSVIDGCDTVSKEGEVTGGGDGVEVGGREGEKEGEGRLEKKNTDAVLFVPTPIAPESSLTLPEIPPLPPSTIPSTPSSIPPLSPYTKSPLSPYTKSPLPPSIKSSLPGSGSVRVTVRELILRMDSVIISTTLSQGGQGQRTSCDGVCDCPEVSFSAGTVDASENTVSYIQECTQPIRNIDLSSKDVYTKDDSNTNCQGDIEAEHESIKNAEHAPTLSTFPIYNTREENRTVISTLSFLSFQTMADEHGEGQDVVSMAQTSSRARTLISAPHVEGTFKFCPATHTSPASACVGALPSRSSSAGSDGPPVTVRGQPTIALDIHLEPLVLSVRQRTVLRWKAIIDDVMGTLPPTKSHTKMTLQLNAPVVDLYVHCDPYFCSSFDTNASQSNLRSESSIGCESPAGTEAGQGQGKGQGTGTGTEERVISGVEELLTALNISPWSK